MHKELARRRRHFMGMIGDNCIAIIPNFNLHIRNGDVHFPFRSNSDFYYLTGFDEPNAVAVFLSESKSRGKFILFCAEKDPKKELWDGDIVGLEGAVSDYFADDAFPIDDIGDILPNFLENRDSLFYNMGSHSYLDDKVIKWINRIKEQSRLGISAPREIISPDHVLHEMRLIKSRTEISKITKAAKATHNAHVRAMQSCQPGMFEYELEAEILYEFNKVGQVPSYPAIVAGGDNACTLHYIDNNQELKSGDLVLIDAGSECENYAADVTRTYPVNGKFTKPQAELYNIVLAAQEASIAKSVPGNHWDDIHTAAVEVITQGLIDLKIIKASLKKAIEDELYREFFMHKTGHWLGMDVHDVGEYKVAERWRLLEPGMVFTVEPGIYIPKTSKALKQYRGIGIRIEDDVVITKDGNKVLTDKTPKTIEAIEKLMAH
jgi:Xaa-Pro aminopeptidase